jgi:hypothetical protein
VFFSILISEEVVASRDASANNHLLSSPGAAIFVFRLMLLSVRREPAILPLAYISPHWAMATSISGTSLPRRPVLVASIILTMSIPSTTFPNTTCLLSRNGVGTVVMKNWEPLVLGPAFC